MCVPLRLSRRLRPMFFTLSVKRGYLTDVFGPVVVVIVVWEFSVSTWALKVAVFVRSGPSSLSWINLGCYRTQRKGPAKVWNLELSVQCRQFRRIAKSYFSEFANVLAGREYFENIYLRLVFLEPKAKMFVQQGNYIFVAANLIKSGFATFVF